MMKRSWRCLAFWIGWIAVTLGATATEYRYSYIPKTVYATQVFPVTILAGDADPNRPVRFEFDPQSPLKPLQFTPVKVRNGNDLFYTFYFMVQGTDDLRLPDVKIRDANTTHTLPGHTIHTDVLNVPDAQQGTFCGLIATDCVLRSSQVSMFDANTTLISVTLQAHGANPEVIHIPGSIEAGIEKIVRTDALVTAAFYFVIPSEQKTITLSYYNTAQHRFVPTTVATDYHNKPVAAQVELNPKASPLDRLKRYGTIALTLFFAVMFVWRRDRLYLGLTGLLLGLLYLLYQPHARLCIREGSPLYILPTHNSRSSTTVTEKLHTQTLGEHAGYHKINYRHGIIGWIRHEDLCQD